MDGLGHLADAIAAAQIGGGGSVGQAMAHRHGTGSIANNAQSIVAIGCRERDIRRRSDLTGTPASLDDARIDWRGVQFRWL